MAPRKPRAAKVNSQAEQLTAALNFVSVGIGSFEFWQEHVRLSDNYAVAFNGQVAAGHPIIEELNVNPHAAKMKAALNRCGKSLVIAETPGGKLSIKGDKLRALVDCLPGEDLPTMTPDQPDPKAFVTEKLKEAFKVCATLASEAADEVVKASLLLEANVCTGTNKQVMLQYWHGVDLPPMIVIPKLFAMAVAKQDKPLTGLGFGWGDNRVSSVTFWFEGGCWIKTLCYADEWPDVSRILNVETRAEAVPAGLWEAVAAVAEFRDTGSVIFADGRVQSHYSTEEGAQYDVPKLQGGKQFAGKLIGQVAPFIKTLDYTTHEDRMFFFGGDETNPIRGVCMGIIEERPAQPYTPQPRTEPYPDMSDEGYSLDDDIPF